MKGHYATAKKESLSFVFYVGGADTRNVVSAISGSETLLLEFTSASLFWPLRSKVAEQFLHPAILTPISFTERPDRPGSHPPAAGLAGGPTTCLGALPFSSSWRTQGGLPTST